MYARKPQARRRALRELLAAVRGRPEIRRMARNPVMLTALAVVHWNERRLPEQRADLYDSIITWLSRSREQRPGRDTADRTVVLLQELALAMQDDRGGPQDAGPQTLGRREDRRRAVRRRHGQPGETVEQAERFLDEEEVDSGIVVGRGHERGFLALDVPGVPGRQGHRQPAGRRTAGRSCSPIPASCIGRIGAKWCLLLAGTLHQQGRAKVDGLIGRLLDGLGRIADAGRPGPLRRPVGGCCGTWRR